MLLFTVVILPFLSNCLLIFGPTDFGGWSYKLTPVRQSVRQCDVFWPFLQIGSKDLPNFLHDCRRQ